MLIDIDTEKIATEMADLTFQELSSKTKSSSYFSEIRAGVINQLITIIQEHPNELEDIITVSVSNLIASKAKDEFAPLIKLINLMDKQRED